MIWHVVHSERRQLAADLEGLSDEQWRRPALCPGWDIHSVLAHLVDTAGTSHLSFVRNLVKARMDFDRANENGIAREKRQDPLDTLAAVAQALAYQLRTPVSCGGGRERAAGLRLIDRQSGAIWGQGDDVTADSLDLLLAVSGRQVVHERVQGGGASRLLRAAESTSKMPLIKAAYVQASGGAETGGGPRQEL